MTADDDRFTQVHRRFFRQLAEQVDRAGDAVGPNDLGLATALWHDASRLRAYADRAHP